MLKYTTLMSCTYLRWAEAVINYIFSSIDDLFILALPLAIIW